MMCLSLLVSALVAGTGRLEIDASAVGSTVSPGLYGVFLEEINNAGEGGLYAELIQNRGFEDANVPPACIVQGNQLATPKKPSFWEGYSKDWTMDWPYYGMGDFPYWSIRGGTMQKTSGFPLTPASKHAAKVSATPGARLTNAGFWGMNVVRGESYDLSLFLRNLTYSGPILGKLIGSDGQILAQSEVRSDSKRDRWTKTAAILRATKSDPKATFALEFDGKGDVLIDFVSLMPTKKWRGLPLRPDLAQMIADLKPGFIRWPGGCVVEGITIETRPRWEETIGPLESRTPTFIPWGYWVSNGFGYHEWLLLCETLKAEPLYVFNAGIACAFRSGTFLTDDELGAEIESILGAIEYAVGPVTSKYGRMRAAAGHPKPFKMTKVEIGNEDQGPKYGARFKRIAAEIKAKYPQMEIILSSWISGIDQPAIDAAGPHLGIVDEHAYKPLNWSIKNFDSFAKYSRQVPWTLYIGEFATNGGVGRGNMAAALGDAAYMMSMEKNADLVKMGSYAPLLENVNRRQWEVNLIHFDSSRAYGRAAYYACQMFAQNLPTVNVAAKLEFAPSGSAPIIGPVGLGTYGTTAEFNDLMVDGKPIASPWHPEDGEWLESDGILRQLRQQGDSLTFTGDGFKDAVLTLRARKVAGNEGFAISFGRADGQRVQFNVGGWGNTRHAIEAGGVIRQVRGSVEAGRWYDVRIETSGRRIRASLDGKQIFDETLPRVDTVLAIAGRDQKRKELVVKLLNNGDHAAAIDVKVKGGRLAPSGSIQTLASPDSRAENDFASPSRISPKTTPISAGPSGFRTNLPPNSISIVRLKIS